MRVPMVSVGDQDVVVAEDLADALDPGGIDHPLHHVLDPVVDDAGNHLARFLQRRGEPTGQRQSPHR